MSAGVSTVPVAPTFERTTASDSRELSDATRQWIRLATLAALMLYGVTRWARLINPAPTWRLFGLFGLGVTLAAGVPQLRHRYGRIPALALAIALCLVALPVAGLQWHSFIHVHIAVSARHIGDGLSALPNAVVPYAGTSSAVRLVIALGAAVLLLDGAIVIAFAPQALGDARRAGAALPLIALAIVPSTLVRPQLPYVQGLVLFTLLALFMWGERIRPDAAGGALGVAAVAGVVAALVAPRLDQHKPLLDYRAWAGTLAHARVVSFDWNQTYGPLHWPQTGHQVLTVRAKTGDYWKAENLDLFNGVAWVLGSSMVSPKLPEPSTSAQARWTQTIQVSITGLSTADVIASGEAGRPSNLAGGALPGLDPGRWVASRTLGPGTTYEVKSYSPQPSAPQLSHAGRHYPDAALAEDLSLTIPLRGTPPEAFTQATFGPFHSTGSTRLTQGGVPVSEPSIGKLMQDSPYAAAYVLAQQLAAQARTPYAFVENVLRYLSHGYTYNQNPPVSSYPLANFLFLDKRGYCQQFSGAMALLLRMGGVPARVAAGFTSGTLDSATGQWVVTDTDAHAWVEVWFPHYGWVRFDPTPAVAPARGGQTSPGLGKIGAGASGSLAVPGRRKAEPGVSTLSATRHGSSSGLSPFLIVPALIVLVALGWLVRSALAPSPGTDDLLAELERAMARTRRPLDAQTTLVALEHRFRDSAAAAAYIRTLRLVRYGGGGVRPSRRGRRALRASLREGLGLSGRVRALWALPPRPRGRPRRQAGA